LVKRHAPAESDRLQDLLERKPFPERAAALRPRVDTIIRLWAEQVRGLVPAAANLPFNQLKDNLPTILPAMADALASVDPDATGKLLERSPAQGVTRFQQHYDVRDLMAEDRLLRRVIIEQTEVGLGRCMNTEEHVALNMAVDAMLQQAVVAFVTHLPNSSAAPPRPS